MKCRFVAIESAESLTKDLFSLEEPWRSRFLGLVASRTVDRASDGRVPTQREVTTWLSDGGLYQEVASLLSVWRGAQI